MKYKIDTIKYEYKDENKSLEDCIEEYEKENGVELLQIISFGFLPAPKNSWQPSDGKCAEVLFKVKLGFNIKK